jgi:hypothetical protein
MNAGEKIAAARVQGCPYCLSHNSARSCPAHGWKEKRNPENRKTAADFKQRGIAFSHNSSGGKSPKSFPEIDGVRHANMPSLANGMRPGGVR